MFFFRTLGWQLLTVFADIFTIYALYRGLHLAVPLSFVILCFGLTLVVSMVSIVPGALVFYESAMTLFYVTLGINVHMALIVTLLFRGLSFWLPMPLGFLLYHRLTRSRPDAEPKPGSVS